jgi:ATP-dependent Lon protease
MQSTTIIPDIDLFAKGATQLVPVVPLRETVMFPLTVTPVLIGRDASLAAISFAHSENIPVLFITQKNPDQESPDEADLHRVGILGYVEQILPENDGLESALVHFGERVYLQKLVNKKPFLNAEITPFPYLDDLGKINKTKLEKIYSEFTSYVRNSKLLPSELLFSFKQLDKTEEKLFFILSYLNIPDERKLQLLTVESFVPLADALVLEFDQKKQFVKYKDELEERTHQKIMDNQKNYFLHEQMRLIQEELDSEGEEADPEFAKLKEAIDKAEMPKDVAAKANEEFQKLKKSPPMSPENHVIRNYLDWLVQVPWTQRTTDRLEIEDAVDILDADHYGLKEPKERIIEYLAVMRLTQKTPGAILCFVGPPGVGKTSLAQSIARALDRRFLRISLGGVRDEAEIRGHRRTYIGAMPGKIVQSMKRAGVVNPVILLDEIDKMTRDFHGDPSSALLEVLDPEQNKNFVDHYLDVDYDLSNVLFITTANFADQIPAPLYDRLEVIDLPGYLEIEKVHIARKYLLPKQVSKNGIEALDLAISDKAISRFINEYTREAGVRNLERIFAKICRKIAVKKVRDEAISSIRIDSRNIRSYLGNPKFMAKKERVAGNGSVTGLAWTQTGGDVLTLEVNAVPGKERFVLTGKLGEVMKESAQAALVYIKANADMYGIDVADFKDRELHLHIPEGAVPKDGPSAGITIVTALLSEFRKQAVPRDIAMTGEITIKGEVLAIGGLKEKIMAARRLNIQRIIIPEQNAGDLSDIQNEVKSGIEFIPVKTYRQVFDVVFA